jgi:hypothetical protein
VRIFENGSTSEVHGLQRNKSVSRAQPLNLRLHETPDPENKIQSDQAFAPRAPESSATPPATHMEFFE